MEISNPAHHFASLARIAYMDEKEATRHVHFLGYTNCKLIEVQGAQCLFLENSERIVLAFRGTEPDEKNDLVADIKAWKTKARTVGSVHDGFYDEVEKLWKTIIRHINYGDREQKKLYICGHSLGGAMATLASSRLKDRIVACYTYGSPRVGNGIWVKENAFTHHRYVNNNDVVPKVPLRLMGFEHHGELHYINFYGNVRQCTWWQRTKDQLRGRWRAICKWQFFDGVFDHNISLYEDKLK